MKEPEPTPALTRTRSPEVKTEIEAEQASWPTYRRPRVRAVTYRNEPIYMPPVIKVPNILRHLHNPWDPLVGTKDLARLLGLPERDHEAIRALQTSPGFPEPVGERKPRAPRYFRRSAIMNWILLADLNVDPLELLYLYADDRRQIRLTMIARLLGLPRADVLALGPMMGAFPLSLRSKELVAYVSVAITALLAAYPHLREKVEPNCFLC